MNTLRIHQAMLSAPLKPTAIRVMLAVLTKTIGYYKTSDDIATSQLETLTGLRSDKIKEGLQDLEEQGFIRIEKGRYGRIISLNPNLIQLENPSPKTGQKAEKTNPEKPTPKTGQTDATDQPETPIDYPPQLNASERKQASHKLKGLSPDAIKTVFNVLKQKLETQIIRSPIAYLTTLINRQRNGTLHTPPPPEKPIFGIKQQGAEDTPQARAAHDQMLADLLATTRSDSVMAY